MMSRAPHFICTATYEEGEAEKKQMTLGHIVGFMVHWEFEPRSSQSDSQTSLPLVLTGTSYNSQFQLPWPGVLFL